MSVCLSVVWFVSWSLGHASIELVIFSVSMCARVCVCDCVCLVKDATIFTENYFKDYDRCFSIKMNKASRKKKKKKDFR